MPKKRRSKRSIGHLFKKSSLTGLIFILIFTLFELAANYPTLQAAKLPGSDEPITLYSNQTQDDLTQLYQQSIESAQESITLIIYSLMDNRVIQSLKRKCEAGIPVYIVCHAQASQGISKKLPHATIVKRYGPGLMHQKILIIDEKTIVLGSANLTYSSLNTHGNLVMGIENPELARLLTARAKSMDEDGGVTPLLHCETTSGPQNIELWVLPDDPSAVDRMIELIRSAKKTIRVAMFTWTRPDFTEELIAASKRGVKVDIVLDHYQAKGTSAKIVKMLDQAGLPVRLSTGQGLLHHKFAYIDGNILVNGSANWTKAAFMNNDDYFMVVYPLTDEQKCKMDDLCQAILKQSEKAEAA